MSTATSSIRNIKSRLSTSNSINNMTTNGNEGKSHGIYTKKPLSATNVLQNYPLTNGCNTHLKKRTVLSNKFYQNKQTKTISTDEKSNHHHHQNNEQSSTNTTHPHPPPDILYAIAPAPSSEEYNHSTKEINDKQQVFDTTKCFISGKTIMNRNPYKLFRNILRSYFICVGV